MEVRIPARLAGGVCFVACAFCLRTRQSSNIHGYSWCTSVYKHERGHTSQRLVKRDPSTRGSKSNLTGVKPLSPSYKPELSINLHSPHRRSPLALALSCELWPGSLQALVWLCFWQLHRGLCSRSWLKLWFLDVSIT